MKNTEILKKQDELLNQINLLTEKNKKRVILKIKRKNNKVIMKKSY